MEVTSTSNALFPLLPSKLSYVLLRTDFLKIKFDFLSLVLWSLAWLDQQRRNWGREGSEQRKGTIKRSQDYQADSQDRRRWWYKFSNQNFWKPLIRPDCIVWSIGEFFFLSFREEWLIYNVAFISAIQSYTLYSFSYSFPLQFITGY